MLVVLEGEDMKVCFLFEPLLISILFQGTWNGEPDVILIMNFNSKPR